MHINAERPANTKIATEFSAELPLNCRLFCYPLRGLATGVVQVVGEQTSDEVILTLVLNVVNALLMKAPTIIAPIILLILMGFLV